MLTSISMVDNFVRGWVRVTFSSFLVVFRPLSVGVFALLASGEAVGAVGVEVVAMIRWWADVRCCWCC